MITSGILLQRVPVIVSRISTLSLFPLSYPFFGEAAKKVIFFYVAGLYPPPPPLLVAGVSEKKLFLPRFESFAISQRIGFEFRLGWRGREGNNYNRRLFRDTIAEIHCSFVLTSLPVCSAWRGAPRRGGTWACCTCVRPSSWSIPRASSPDPRSSCTGSQRASCSK